jgi:hypothetical protein
MRKSSAVPSQPVNRENRIFLPLRSNAAWFASADTRKDLERRMKRYALLYDEVVLQDGRYSFTVIPTGSADQYTPSRMAGVDRSQISYFSPGGRFAIQVSREPGGEFHPLLEGEKIASYEVDFYPILHDAELLGRSLSRRMRQSAAVISEQPLVCWAG